MSETNKTTIAADWCEKKLPELARFNKAFIKRKGKGFAHVIVLTSENKEDINYCYEKESALFESFGWYCVLMNGDSVPKPVLWYSEQHLTKTRYTMLLMLQASAGL